MSGFEIVLLVALGIIVFALVGALVVAWGLIADVTQIAVSVVKDKHE